MLKRRFSLSFLAILVVLSLVFQGTMVLAGTTGGLSGTVLDSTSKQPLAGVKVTAASPQQTVSATTDSAGHFAFLNLSPDTYTVSVEAQGYQPTTLAGVTITADNTRVVSVNADKQLKTIGRVTTRSNGALVKPGTTADVYSVNPTVQTKVAAAGGAGQSGYIGAGATLSIRGGDYDQIGYEIDGVPVNRAFDNYPSGPTSSLGQQELQVYTGAPPAGSTSQGISGYVNQVIKTGTYPAFSSLDIGDGGPAYYHKLSFEYGGTTTDRRFSYYFALGGYNQEYRYGNQFQGTGISNLYGTPTEIPCAGVSITVSPSCYVNGQNTVNGLVQVPFSTIAGSTVYDRDNDVNLHYYFPHKDGSRDDLQALYQVNSIKSEFFSSPNDLGGDTFLNASGFGAPFYIDGYNLNLPTGGFLPTNYRQYASIYSFPNTPAHSFDAPIQSTLRDDFVNNQAIEKLQFTKSLGSNAYFRAYGYSYYSNWLQTGPNCTYDATFCGTSADYELSSHTRGVSFTAADQINAQNLLTLEGDYTTSSVVRDNNTQMINGLYGTTDPANLRTAIGVLVNSKAPTNGICYSIAGTPVNCYASPTAYNSGAGGAQFATIEQAYAGDVVPITAPACGTGACQYLVTGNGQYATYNAVKPNFYGASLTDEFRPTSKLTINGGLRLDDYQYVGSDTSGGNARAFWYAAYNREMCLNPASQLVETKASLGLTAAQSCTTAAAENTNFTNPTGAVTSTYPVFQPRIGATYSVDPNTVLRASYGRYGQPPNSAFEQYNFLQSDAPQTLYGSYGFQQYGFTTPDHAIPPAASNNYDFSIEHQFPGQVSVKITPFLRKTQNQIEQFYLDRATSFVSGLNVGNQTSEGAEFELDKGDFAREGLAAKLSFAYTHSYIKYNTLSNGTTVLTPVVNAIKAYNALTKAGGGAACYTLATATANGVAAPGCGAGTIANPYYNAPEQDLSPYSAGSISIPYDTIPAGIGLDSTQIGYPFVTSLVLNEKIKKLSITPVVQWFAGQRYGDPEATYGIDPTTCTGALGTPAAGDPRYQFGTQAGAGYNAGTCGQLDSIPNLQTGTFDGIGAYVEPSQLLLHIQVAYEVAKNVTLTANLANIVNTCFGGTKVPWAVSGACSYGLTNEGITGGVGNVYNPGQAIQPSGAYSYGPIFNQQPFGIFVDANIKM
jgi:hypothetical protein